MTTSVPPPAVRLHLPADREGPPQGPRILRSRPGPEGSAPAGTPHRHVCALGAASGQCITPSPAPCAPRPLTSAAPRAAVPGPLTGHPSLGAAPPRSRPFTSAPSAAKPRPPVLIGRPLLALRGVDTAAVSDWLQRPPVCGEMGGAPGAASLVRDRTQGAGQAQRCCPRLAARGPARFIPASLGARGARQPPPPAAVRRQTGAALRRPPGEWRPRVSNVGPGVGGAPP